MAEQLHRTRGFQPRHGTECHAKCFSTWLRTPEDNWYRIQWGACGKWSASVSPTTKKGIAEISSAQTAASIAKTRLANGCPSSASRSRGKTRGFGSTTTLDQCVHYQLTHRELLSICVFLVRCSQDKQTKSLKECLREHDPTRPSCRSITSSRGSFNWKISEIVLVLQLLERILAGSVCRFLKTF